MEGIPSRGMAHRPVGTVWPRGPRASLDDNISEKSIASSILGTRHPTPSLTALGIPKAGSTNYPNAEARDGKLREAPTIIVAEKALKDISELLRGKSRGKCGGYIPPDFNPYVKCRLDGMRTLLSLYTTPGSSTYGKWIPSSEQAAITLHRNKNYCGRILRQLTRAYIQDREVLPINPYGEWCESLLVDEDLCHEINLFLQSLGDQITAQKLANFLSQPDIKERHGIDVDIHVTTACRYLKALNFRFSCPPKGQYADGHEHQDVVDYRDKAFIPKVKALEPRMQKFDPDSDPTAPLPITPFRPIVPWSHDESIFYAHDRRRSNWYHKDAPAVPYAKGDGLSFMVARAVSPDYGWLEPKPGCKIYKEDGTEVTAHRTLKPGKNRDGYFTSEGVLDQFRDMVAIAKSSYPDDDHVFFYDNAPSHLKRSPGALSARKMPMKTPKEGTNWLVDVPELGSDNKPIRDSITGAVRMKKVRMADGRFHDGTPQSLYFPEGHPRAGIFKGMKVILQERGYDVADKKAACGGAKFNCTPGATDCCCRRMLFNEPDFVNVKTQLQELAESLGVEVIYLPKYHCELNPIEQCWGFAKRLYRLNPLSSREDHLEANTLAALDAVPLQSIRKFSTRSHRFLDAYYRGLNGRQAAWATHKYRGHWVLPLTIMQELDDNQIT
ncbi:hypothetical protein NP233_g1146 [Leucocoprinus birnbaumii]|uniref:Tc1-like transposase DDE domain-containing protein n=1 Tax=Leucocoprinus birnbaumii TaxID=56174 RepID=A0AAD5W347_9AGAR|nr:hypothetical protein NP233_g1146 [Leucocoprinus birnbaumii]